LAIWVMLLGMATLINITMVGALLSLVGNIPDSSFLVILSSYLKKKDEPREALLFPLEAASRLERLRRRVLQAAAAAAAVGTGLSVWALVVGWGAVAMLAITTWMVAANLAFYHIPLALWKRRAGKMREEAVEEAGRKSQPEPTEQAVEESRPDAADSTAGEKGLKEG